MNETCKCFRHECINLGYLEVTVVSDHTCRPQSNESIILGKQCCPCTSLYKSTQTELPVTENKSYVLEGSVCEISKQGSDLSKSLHVYYAETKDFYKQGSSDQIVNQNQFNYSKRCTPKKSEIMWDKITDNKTEKKFCDKSVNTDTYNSNTEKSFVYDKFTNTDNDAVWISEATQCETFGIVNSENELRSKNSHNGQSIQKQRNKVSPRSNIFTTTLEKPTGDSNNNQNKKFNQQLIKLQENHDKLMGKFILMRCYLNYLL